MHGVLMGGAAAGPPGVRAGGGRDGGRLRQPGRAGDRAGRGPGRAAAGGHARRARADRGRPARPRDPAAVRGRAVAAGHRRQPRGRARRPTGSWRTVDDLDATIRQIRTSIFQLQQHPQTPARRAAGAAARRGDRPDPGAGLRAGGPLLRRDRRRRRRRGRGRARRGPRVAEQRRPARAARGRRGRRGRDGRPADRRRPRRRRRARPDQPPQRPGQPAPTGRAPRRHLHASSPREPAGTWLSWSVPLA